MTISEEFKQERNEAMTAAVYHGYYYFHNFLVDNDIRFDEICPRAKAAIADYCFNLTASEDTRAIMLRALASRGFIPTADGKGLILKNEDDRVVLVPEALGYFDNSDTEVSGGYLIPKEAGQAIIHHIDAEHQIVTPLPLKKKPKYLAK